MKRFLLLVLALMMALSSTAFAFDPTRFTGVDGVVVDYDPAEPTRYSVTAGFAEQTASGAIGGHMLVRYKNAGKSEELPLILISFTAPEKVTRMTVRTDESKYDVICTDLAAQGLSAIESEATVLVTADSRDMLGDMAKSAFVLISLWDEDPADAYSFLLSAPSRKTLALFLEEYDAEVQPKLTEGSTLEYVYSMLSPIVDAEDAPAITEEVSAIMNADYDTLKNGSQSDAVVRLQQTLIDMELLTGKADGVYGNQTGKAVSAFQSSVGMKATGIADPDTQKALYLMELALSGDIAG